MNIDTKFTGNIEIKDEEIINFPEGILGFEDQKRYVIIDIGEEYKFKILQSVDIKELSFIIINPWDVFPDYEVNIDDDEVPFFGDNDLNNFLVYTIVTVSQGKATANLMGPIILNTKTCIGRQAVLHKSGYTTKHIIKQFEKKE